MQTIHTPRVSSIQELKARLAELEKKKHNFKEYVKTKDELVNKLNNHKKKMLDLKKRYDVEALGYIESLMELEEVTYRIKRLGGELGIEHLNDYLVDIPGLYGYLGNLNDRNPYLVIHESIAPATHGKELWQLIKRKG
jgi:hypothetical protein